MVLTDYTCSLSVCLSILSLFCSVCNSVPPPATPSDGHTPACLPRSQTREAGAWHPPAQGQGRRTDSQRSSRTPRSCGLSSGSGRSLSTVTPWATRAWMGGREAGPWTEACVPGLVWAPAFPSSCHFSPLGPASLGQMRHLRSGLCARTHARDPTESSCPILEVKESDTPSTHRSSVPLPQSHGPPSRQNTHV